MTVLATPNFGTNLNLCDLYRHPHWSNGFRVAPSIRTNALQSIWHLLPTTKIHGWLGVSEHVTRLPHRMMVDQHVIHSSYGAVRRGGPTSSWIHSAEEIHCHDCLWLRRAFKPCFFYHFLNYNSANIEIALLLKSCASIRFINTSKFVFQLNVIFMCNILIFRNK
jgi:hypothetical protein